MVNRRIGQACNSAHFPGKRCRLSLKKSGKMKMKMKFTMNPEKQAAIIIVTL